MITTDRLRIHESNSNNNSSILTYIQSTRVSISLPLNGLAIGSPVGTCYEASYTLITNEDFLKTSLVLETSTMIRLTEEYFPEVTS